MDDYKFGTEIIPEVFRLHETHGYEQCESFINKLLNDENADMTEIQQWELKQLLWGFTNNPHKEIECLDKIIQLENAQEIGSFFIRGTLKFQLKDFTGALDDFDYGILLSERFNNTRYSEMLYFLRADSYYRLGLFEKALTNLEHVYRDDNLWTDQLKSKPILLKEINAAIQKKIIS